MKILIVEDDPIRILNFKDKLGQDNDLDVTQDPDEAVVLCRKNQYDVMFLDHDLSEQYYGGELKGTGYDFAVWLEEHPEVQQQTKIIVHSLNAVGANRMMQALHHRNPVRAPWIWLKEVIFTT